jgi:hypothetical protein
VTNGHCRGIAVVDPARQQLADHGRQTWRAASAQRRRRLPRSDALVEQAGVGRLERQAAAHHLVEQDADRPEIGLRIDLPRVEPFGRQVGDAAEVVARHLSAQRQRLGDSEIEDLDPIVARHLDVARLEIAVEQRAQRPPVDGDFEGVRRLEKLAQLDRDAGRAFGAQDAAGDHLGERRPLEILHRDVEIAPLGRVLVDRRHMTADAAELFLQLRSPALGAEDFARFAIVSRGYQLQRDAPAGPGVGGEEHRRHPAAADLLENLVRSDPLEYRRHHRP